MHTGNIFPKNTVKKESERKLYRTKEKYFSGSKKKHCPSKNSSWLLIADMPEPSKKRHITISKQEEPDRLWMWTANSSCWGIFFWLRQILAFNTSQSIPETPWHWGMHLGCGVTTWLLLTCSQLSSRPVRSLSAVMLVLPPWNYRSYFCQNGYFMDDSQLQTIRRNFYLSFYI